jgi:hypothetical protein
MALTRDELLRMGNRDRLAVIRDGHAIPPEAIENHGYRGIALGLPAFIERLTWKTFQKTFLRDAETGALRGWNVRVEQRGIDAPSVARIRRGRPWTFGHYEVTLAGEGIPRIQRTRGLLIDYSLGVNATLDPMRRIKDPIVAVNADRFDLLLGWSYFDLGFIAFGTPSFFTLEREGTLSAAEIPEVARVPRAS